MKHEQAREEGAERSARLSQSQVLAVSYGAQWKPLRQASLSLPELPDQLWGNARNATVWVEDPYRGVVQALLMVMRRGSLRATESYKSSSRHRTRLPVQ